MTLPNYEKDNVRKLFEELGRDEYSYLWHVVGDFEINGHEVSITSSKQFGHVIIDNVYVRVKDGCIITAHDRKFSPIEYAMYKLGF